MPKIPWALAQQTDATPRILQGYRYSPPIGQNQLGDLELLSKAQWDPASLIKKSTNNKL